MTSCRETLQRRVTRPTLDSVFQDQESGYPTQREVLAKQECFKGIIQRSGAGFPSGLSFDAGKGLTIGMPIGNRNDTTVKLLTEYANVMDYKFPTEIRDGLLGIDKNFNFNLADTQIGSWIDTGSGLVSQALAESTVIQEFGSKTIALGTMTIDMIKKGGYVSDEAVMSMSMSTGSLIGGVVGSIIPGIGTAIGTAVGAAIGASVGAIINATRRPDWKGAEKAAAARAAAAFAQNFGRCNDLQKALNDYMFEEIYRISTQWINAERTLGYRIPLRWFEPNPGMRFEFAAQGQGQYLNRLMGGMQNPRMLNQITPVQNQDGFPYPYGRFKCFSTLKARQGRMEFDGTQFTVRGVENSGFCNFYCPEKVLGCLYPDPGSNEFHAYGSPRVVGAFHSRGISLPADMDCGRLRPVTEYIRPNQFPGHDKIGAPGRRAKRDYEAAIAREIEAQTRGIETQAEIKLAQFQEASRIVSSDLVRTIALMQAQSTILINRVKLEGQGVIDDASFVFVGLRNQHRTRMRNIAIAGGAALTAAAFFGVG